MLVHLFSLGVPWQLRATGDCWAEQTFMYKIYICMQKATVTEKACVFPSITNLKAELPLPAQLSDLTADWEFVIPIWGQS